MKGKVNTSESGERRTNYRAYLEINARYLTEIAQFEQARKIYEDASVFSVEEQRKAIREIDLIQMIKS
ncbi:hypothetical protein [Komagataeibacter europaeus]|nr:hypothetical protein [Komagataeibacter europaeus]